MVPNGIKKALYPLYERYHAGTAVDRRVAQVRSKEGVSRLARYAVFAADGYFKHPSFRRVNPYVQTAEQVIFYANSNACLKIRNFLFLTFLFFSKDNGMQPVNVLL